MSSHDLHFAVEGGAPSGPMDTTMNTTNTTTPTMNSQMAAIVSQSAHPTVCLFHILFKGAAFVLYVFGGWFARNSSANFIVITVLCILLLSADFWVVKNITGRLLVGLRWWNKVEGNETRWIYESAENANPNKFDSRVFWTILYATPVVWAFLAVIGILKLELGWLLTVVMALALSGANVYGYYKCSSDQKAKFQQMMQQGAQAGAMSMLRSGLFGVLAGQGNAQQPPQQQQQQSSYV